MEEERWAKYKVPYSKYSVSTHGRVRNDNTGVFPKLYLEKNGYYTWNATADRVDGQVGPCKQHHIFIHKAMGEVFLPNPDMLPKVDHIDRVKKNNYLPNLRWASNATQRENQERPARNAGRPVDQFSTEGEFIKAWSTRVAACEAHGLATNSISKFIESGKPYGGFVWRNPAFADDEEWRTVPIEGMAFTYQASDQGRIRKSTSDGAWAIVNQTFDSGVVQVSLFTGEAYKVKGVATLVALAFLGPPPQSDHKQVTLHRDGDIRNNVPSNLYWGRHPGPLVLPSSRGVTQYTRKGELVRKFPTASEAMRNVKLKSSTGILKSAKHVEKEYDNDVARAIAAGSVPLARNHVWVYTT